MARLTVTPVRLELRNPLRTAWGELRARDLLELRLDFGDGDEGRGEAAPLEPYDGVPLAAVAAALDAYGAVLADAGPGDPHADLLAACAAERPLPAALAAVDLALWDRAGRRAGRPVAELLAPSPAPRVAVNATLGAEDRAGAAEQAAAAAAAGFGCVKVKVGVGDDAGRLAAVRAAARARAGDPGRRQRRLGVAARGAGQPARAGARRPGAGRGADPRRRGAARGARRVPGAGGDGRDGGRARRRRARAPPTSSA